MRLWKRKYRTERQMPALVKTALAKFNERLVRIAHFLEQKTNRYSTKKKKLLLLVFIILFVSQSIRTLIESFKNKNANPISISRIKTIRFENQSPTPRMDRREYLRLQGFRNYVDSLDKTAEGRRMRDSLFKYRPHLMDSLRFLLNLYSKQSNTIK